MAQREPRQVFWILVFIALAAIIVYVLSLIVAPGTMLPVLGLTGAACGLSLWGAWRLYRRKRWIPALLGGVVALLCCGLAVLTCLELSENLPFLKGL